LCGRDVSLQQQGRRSLTLCNKSFWMIDTQYSTLGVHDVAQLDLRGGELV
jgi:hypothetical protein